VIFQTQPVSFQTLPVSSVTSGGQFSPFIAKNTLVSDGNYVNRRKPEICFWHGVHFYDHGEVEVEVWVM
jgi:hypothetical protein